MSQRAKPKGIEKGKYLELRVARLLFAEGLTPFLNVYFRKSLDPRSINNPDVDVLGCSLLPDASVLFAHYDCKSGDSEVVSRILMLNGLRNRIPSGPITYIRKSANLDIKRYAINQGIRICNMTQFEEWEREFVIPIFGENFPSISDIRVHELWRSLKGKAKDKQLGRIIKYFDSEFWMELPFTRLRRAIAGTELIQRACSECGIVGKEQDLLVADVIRRFLFSLLSATSQVAFLSNVEIEQAVSEWLITETLSVQEYQTIVESAAQLIFEIYGDPHKGPMSREDYYIPPPEYAEELVSLLRRTLDLYDTLHLILPAYDAFVLEASLLGRESVSNALLRGATSDHRNKAKVWLRSLRLFLAARQPSLKQWSGWTAVMGEAHFSA